MFPYSSFSKNFANNQLVTICFSKYSYVLNFDNFITSISGECFLYDPDSKLSYPVLTIDTLTLNIDWLSKLLLLELNTIQEFDKSEEYPEGCIIFYFETGYELRVIFSPYYESCVITFNEGEDKGVWVF